jgi:hypothetical protein
MDVSADKVDDEIAVVRAQSEHSQYGMKGLV